MKNQAILTAILVFATFTGCDELFKDDGGFALSYDNPNDGTTCADIVTKWANLNTTGNCDADADNDSICDDDEKTLGTETDVKDVFVEIDYMDASADKGMVISKTALDMMRAAYSDQGIRLHIDVGSLVSGTDKFSAIDYNYCGGNEVPFATTIALGSAGDNCGGGDCAEVSALRSSHMAASRMHYFHYAINGNTSSLGNGVAGLAETPGRLFYATLGGDNYNSAPYTDKWRDGNMAATLIHELGHTLNLLHGGNEDENYKPNYVSVMNYGYSFGLGKKGTADTWLALAGDADYGGGWLSGNACISSLGVDPLNDTWVIDYSKGSYNDIDESNIKESVALKGTAVDLDCDGNKGESSYSYNLNNEGGITTLSDFNDWSRLNYSGQIGAGLKRLIADSQVYYTDGAVRRAPARYFR